MFSVYSGMKRLSVLIMAIVIAFSQLLTGCSQDQASIAKERGLPVPFVLQLWEDGCVPANLVAHTVYWSGGSQWDQYQIMADADLNLSGRLSLPEALQWLHTYPSLPYDTIAYPWSIFLKCMAGTIDNNAPILSPMSQLHMGTIMGYTWKDSSITGFGWMDPAARSSSWGSLYGIQGCYVHTPLSVAMGMMPTYNGNIQGIAMGSDIYRPFIPPGAFHEVTGSTRSVPIAPLMSGGGSPTMGENENPIYNLPVADGGACPGCPLPDTLAMQLYSRAMEELCRFDSTLTWFITAYMSPQEIQGMHFGPILGIHDMQGSMFGRSWNNDGTLVKTPSTVGFKSYAEMQADRESGQNPYADSQPTSYYQVTMIDGSNREFGVLLLAQAPGYSYGGIAFYPSYLDPGLPKTTSRQPALSSPQLIAARLWANWKTNPDEFISDVPAMNVFPVHQFIEDGYKVNYFFEWSSGVPEGIPYFPYIEVSDDSHDVFAIYDRFGQQYERDANGELRKAGVKSAVTDDAADSRVPREFGLRQNYPNPFNSSTNIGFALDHPSSVKLEIYDVLGRKIHTLVSGYIEAGDYSFVWNGTDERGCEVASGIYLYRLTAGKFTETKKMVLMK